MKRITLSYVIILKKQQLSVSYLDKDFKGIGGDENIDDFLLRQLIRIWPDIACEGEAIKKGASKVDMLLYFHNIVTPDLVKPYRHKILLCIAQESSVFFTGPVKKSWYVNSWQLVKIDSVRVHTFAILIIYYLIIIPNRNNNWRKKIDPQNETSSPLNSYTIGVVPLLPCFVKLATPNHTSFFITTLFSSFYYFFVNRFFLLFHTPLQFRHTTLHQIL